ncbi:uncharacterized protein LAJ45_03934 [Morchella importuna]|uniref:uncharacterized protein n=1 Tax=Morchella importuna TaxID=1174673 RepID=UPI001E8D2631|nr:uncharacterized protein LAJ45_03934 [Morchella importuna]KAH8151941.1 hypothetical protein LAJ45_03934 [Morchella importuna]
MSSGCLCFLESVPSSTISPNSYRHQDKADLTRVNIIGHKRRAIKNFPGKTVHGLADGSISLKIHLR